MGAAAVQRIVLSTAPKKGSLRVDKAWSFFCGPRKTLGRDRGFWLLSNWLWDELGAVAGSLNANSSESVEITIPALREDALDFVLRLVSYWANDVRIRRGRSTSGNLWKRPIINLFHDRERTGAERALFGDFSEAGSKELNLMPMLGPGRAFFSLQLIEKGDSTTRLHSHSTVDEYYLILAGHGTLRFNGKAIAVGPGDLIAKPTGPDAASHLNADRGEALRILDMEIWHEPFKGSRWTTKDLVYYPDHGEMQMRGPGWSAVVSRESLLGTDDLESHWSDLYRRTRDGKRKPMKSPGRKRRANA